MKNKISENKELPRTMWEINYHYIGEKFTHCTVTQITVVQEGIPECFSIVAKDENGQIFKGNIKDYFLTEKEALQQAVKECEEKLKKVNNLK